MYVVMYISICAAPCGVINDDNASENLLRKMCGNFMYSNIISETGKITVGLASHWPCGTDFSGLSTYELHDGHREGDEH